MTLPTRNLEDLEVTNKFETVKSAISAIGETQTVAHNTALNVVAGYYHAGIDEVIKTMQFEKEEYLAVRNEKTK